MDLEKNSPAPKSPSESHEPKGAHVEVFSAPEKLGFLKSFVSEWVLSVKVIYLILVLIIAVELFFGARTLLQPTPASPQIQPISEGRVVLSSTKLNYSIGDTIPVDIYISTGGYSTVGTDLSIKYDPNLLEAPNDGFVKGGIYQDYLGINIDNKKGVILVSGIVSINSGGFNGTGKFGTLNLRAKAEGKTKVALDFKKGATVDTNIIEDETSVDILGKTFDLELGIGSAKVVEREDGASCSEFKQLCWNEEGKQGIQTCKKGAVKDKACSYDPYLTLECSKCGTN
jgi:hypothetical protein